MIIRIMTFHRDGGGPFLEARKAMNHAVAQIYW